MNTPEKNRWVWIKEAPHVLRENYGINISERSLRNWRFWGRYPGMFTTLGRKVFIDLEMMLRIMERNRIREAEKDRQKSALTAVGR